MHSSQVMDIRAHTALASFPDQFIPDDTEAVLPISGNEERARRPVGSIFIVDRRVLERECLAHGLYEHQSKFDVKTVGSLHELTTHANGLKVSAVVIVMAGRSAADQSFADDVAWLRSAFSKAAIILLADSDDPGEILAALECGAHGYIPTSVTIDVVSEAIALVQAGGKFVPASAILALRDTIHAQADNAKPLGGIFTMREAEVVEELRRGKANKIIAYELNLCESTVKVHIRNIMKKLRATNRTEVAYKLRDLAVQVRPGLEERADVAVTRS